MSNTKVFKDKLLNNARVTASLTVPLAYTLKSIGDYGGQVGQIVYVQADDTFYVHDSITWTPINTNSNSLWVLNNQTPRAFIQNTQIDGVQFGTNNLVFGSSSTDNIGSTESVRLMFIGATGESSIGSFRAGCATSTQWDSVNCGKYSVAFGKDTRPIGDFSLIGGYKNTASQICSTVLNGFLNTSKGYQCIICNGTSNSINTSVGMIGNGVNNKITSGIASVIINGFNNIAAGDRTTIINGTLNSVGAKYSTVINGNSNTAANNYALIGNGRYNSITVGRYSTVINGKSNTIYTGYATVVNGLNNTIASQHSAILTGFSNYIGAQNSAIIAGNTLTLTQAETAHTRNLRIGDTTTARGGLQMQGFRTITAGNSILLSTADHTVEIIQGIAGTATAILPAVPVQGQQYYIIGVPSGGTARINTNSISYALNLGTSGITGVGDIDFPITSGDVNFYSACLIYNGTYWQFIW